MGHGHAGFVDSFALLPASSLCFPAEIPVALKIVVQQPLQHRQQAHRRSVARKCRNPGCLPALRLTRSEHAVAPIFNEALYGRERGRVEGPGAIRFAIGVLREKVRKRAICSLSPAPNAQARRQRGWHRHVRNAG